MATTSPQTKKVKIKTPKRPTSKITLRLISFISEGFFKQKRSISDIQFKLRDKAINISQQKLQPYLSQLVKNDKLQRTKIMHKGKKTIFILCIMISKTKE